VSDLRTEERTMTTITITIHAEDLEVLGRYYGAPEFVHQDIARLVHEEAVRIRAREAIARSDEPATWLR
jgi:hypothetical protein